MNIRDFIFGKGSSVAKSKQKVLNKAEKELNYLDKAETPATREVKAQTGAESDIDKSKKRVAKTAREKLRAMAGL